MPLQNDWLSEMGYSVAAQPEAAAPVLQPIPRPRKLKAKPQRSRRSGWSGGLTPFRLLIGLAMIAFGGLFVALFALSIVGSAILMVKAIAEASPGMVFSNFVSFALAIIPLYGGSLELKGGLALLGGKREGAEKGLAGSSILLVVTILYIILDLAYLAVLRETMPPTVISVMTAVAIVLGVLAGIQFLILSYCAVAKSRLRG
jgi:hypothetical protein